MTVYRFSEEYTLANIEESSQLYTWIKYADDNLGNGMSDSPEGKNFMGIAYNKLTIEESSNPSDYEWIDIKGADGIPGPPGTSTYTWIKYSLYSNGDQMQDDPNGMIYMGIAYNKNTPQESTDPNDYEWARFRGENGLDGKPGTPGEDGISPIIATIESTQGNFFKQGIGTTTLQVKVFQAADDVSEQCTFRWYKIDQNSEVPDTSWSKTGNNITITQDDVEAKSTFFVEVSYTNLTALANYTISDLFDMNPSIVPPANPQEGQVWLDISKDPPVLMVYSKGEWKPSAKDWTEEINEISKDITIINQNVSNVQSDITNLNNEIKLKVSQDTLDETTKILNANISGLQDQLNNLELPGLNLANLYGDKQNVFNAQYEGKATYNDFEITVSKIGKYAGLNIYNVDKLLKVNEEYIFSYKFQKVSGVLQNIGGHLDSLFINPLYIQPIKLFLDGKEYNIGNYIDTIPLEDNTDIHEIVIKFKVIKLEGGPEHQTIYIQPNRGSTEGVVTKIWDIMFEKSSVQSEWQPSASDMLYLGKMPENINIIRNSAFNDLANKFAYWRGGSGNNAEVNWSDGMKINYVTLSKTEVTDANRGFFEQRLDLGDDELNQIRGKTLTFSCYGILNNHTGGATSDVYINFHTSEGNKTQSLFKPKDFGNTWTLLSGSVTVPDLSISKIELTFAFAGTYSFYIAKPMLNIGLKPYAWNPSPKDAEKAANDAKAQAIVYTDSAVTDAKAEIQVQINQINLSVEQNSQHVQQVIKDLNDLTLDTYNMLDYSSFRPETKAIVQASKWLCADSTRVVFGAVQSSHITPNDNSLLGEFWANFDRAEGHPWATVNVYPQKTLNIGEKYTISAWLWNRGQNVGSWIRVALSDYEDMRDVIFEESPKVKDIGVFKLVTHTFTATKKYGRFQAVTDGLDFAICHPMWSQSSKYVPWQPSPVEMGDRVEENVKQIAQIKIDVGSVTTTVSNLSNSITQINGNVEKLSQRLSTAEQKITPDAITNTVTSNTIYQNDVKGKIDAVQIGGRNLVLNSDVNVTNSDYLIFTRPLSQQEPYVDGVEYTCTIKGTLGGEKKAFNVFNSGGYIVLCSFNRKELESGICSKTFRWRHDSNGQYPASNKYINVFVMDNANPGTSHVEWIKIEKGNKATSWTPAIEDTQQQIDGKATVEPIQVRYIRDWLGGSTVNSGKHWVEIQAWKGTENLALGKKPFSNGQSLRNPQYLNDGYFENSDLYSEAVADDWAYVQIDLGAIYNLDSIKVWHYYADKRSYHTKLEVSSDGTTWKQLFNSETQGMYEESLSGRTYIVNKSDFNQAQENKPALNLLYNSGFTETGAVGWNRNPGNISWWTKNDSSAMSGKRIELSTFGRNQGIYQRNFRNIETRETVPFKAGLSIVYSGYIYSNRVGDFTIGLEGCFTKNVRIITAQKWTYFEVAGIANGTAHTSIFYSQIEGEVLWTMKDLKLEYGTKATPWNVGPGEIGNRLQQSELKLTPESIIARVYEKAQGSNLIANSAVVGGNFPWRFTLNTQYWTGFLGVVEPTAVAGWCMRLANDDTHEKYAFSNRFSIESGKPITISFDIWTDSDCQGGDVFLLSSNDNALLNDIGCKEIKSTSYNKVYNIGFGKHVGYWQHYEKTFYPEGNSAYIRVDHNGATNQGYTANRIWVRNLMVNKGEIALPWSDNTGSVGEAELKITSDSIIAKVESGIINGNPIDASSIKVARDGFTVQNAGYWTNLNGPKMDVRRGDSNGPLATRINYGFQVFNDSTNQSDYLGGIMKKKFSEVDWYMSMVADEDTWGMGFCTTQGSGGETDFGNPWMVYNQVNKKELNILTETYWNDKWMRGIRVGDGARINLFYQQSNEMNINRGTAGMYFNYVKGPDYPTDKEVYVKICNGNKGTGKLIANLSGTRAASFMVMPTSFNLNPMPAAETFSSSAVQPLLEDIGEITIGDDGEGYFALNQTFISGINNTLGYQVITEKYSKGEVEFVERFPTHFIIHGTPGMRVGFVIKGKVQGEETRHLQPTTIIDDGSDVGEHSDLYNNIIPKVKREEQEQFNGYNHEIDMVNNYRPIKRQAFEIKEQEEFEKLTIEERAEYIKQLKEYLDSQPSRPMTVRTIPKKSDGSEELNEPKPEVKETVNKEEGEVQPEG